MAIMTVRGMLTVQPCQSVQLRLNGRQLFAQCERKEIVRGTALPVVRTDLAPAAQQAVFVARFCTEALQALAKMGDAHRVTSSESQCGFKN